MYSTSSSMTADRPLLRLALVTALACLTASLASISRAQPGSGVATEADRAVVGTVDGKPVIAGEIVGQHSDAFRELKDRHDQKLHLLELEYASDYHDLLQKNLDEFLDRRALELEAAARHTTPDKVLADVKVAVVTDQEAHALYDAHKNQVNQPYDQVEGQIREVLASQHNEAALRSFYQELRARHHVVAQLPPYRVEVAASGPTRGKPDARITIVEFADFQCPFCREAESSLQTVIDKYPNDVRLVFRHMPLADLHPNAVEAARAAICADQQGRFWDMHDAMFKDQSALGADALKTTATRLGLDSQRFSTCLDNAADTSGVLGADAKAAADLGINSTPYFFIDGRPLRGTAPPEQFEKIIEDELSHEPAGRSRGT
jgi:protein-disulfide isomerase